MTGRLALLTVALAAGAATALAPAAPAAADPVSAGRASAFAVTASLGGTEAVPPTPLSEMTAPGDDAQSLVDVPAEPVAVSGTLQASSSVHAVSDLDSTLTGGQTVEGPFNARGVALIEGADVLLDAPTEGVSLVSADVIRAEAVAVCRAGAVEYAAGSEIVNLQVGGNDIPVNAPVQDLIDAISEQLVTSGLSAVVDVRRNVVTPLDDGIAVDALVISVIETGGPAASVTIGHAESTGAACGPITACSDGIDNEDPEDTLGDAADPGCHTDGDAGNAASYDPSDPDETDGPSAQCSNNVDDDDAEDTLADAADPGCHTDGDADNPDTYDAADPDESDPGTETLPAQAQPEPLPRTGGGSAVAVGTGLGLAALALAALGRRASA